MGLLCLVHFALALTAARHKSNTYDELAHLTRGYSYTLTGDFRLGSPHPPLAHYWAALPGRGTGVRFPYLDQPYWHRSDVWNIGRQFFYQGATGNAARIDTLLLQGRSMIALLSCACGVLVFLWSRQMFGLAGGFVSLTLFAFCPSLLAHAGLVTTDTAVTLFFLAALAALRWVLDTVSPASMLCGALAMTGLFLAKMSAILIVPTGLILLGLRLLSSRPLILRMGRRQREIRGRLARLGCGLAVIPIWAVAAWLGLWAAYGFRYEAMTSAQPGRDTFYSSSPAPPGKDVWEHQLRKLDHLRGPVSWLRAHRVLPEAYIYSAVASAQTARGRNAFLNGKISLLGHRWFFPYAFLVKTPLPLFGLLAAAAAVPVWRFLRKRAPHQEKGSAAPPPVADQMTGRRLLWYAAPLVVFLLVYWGASLRSHLNIGHRHILPTYPVLYILCGATAAWLRPGRRAAHIVSAVLLGLFVLAGLSVYPHYLAFFNRLAGGPGQGYRHLVDSSLDWGQDLPGLHDYLAQRSGADSAVPTYVAVFGSGGGLALTHFEIRAQALPLELSADGTGDYALHPGRYIVSATRLQQLYDDADGRTPLHTWTDKLERQYQGFLPQFEKFAASADDADTRRALATAQFRAAFERFRRQRLARLCAWLRRQEPDDMINYTLLVFDLDAGELDGALRGPAPLDGPGRHMSAEPAR